jgi:hypothetical protein
MMYALAVTSGPRVTVRSRYTVQQKSTSVSTLECGINERICRLADSPTRRRLGVGSLSMAFGQI